MSQWWLAFTMSSQCLILCQGFQTIYGCDRRGVTEVESGGYPPVVESLFNLHVRLLFSLHDGITSSLLTASYHGLMID